jgi:hypothetical protein
MFAFVEKKFKEDYKKAKEVISEKRRRGKV